MDLDVKDYLFKAKEIELSCFEQGRLINILEKRINQLKLPNLKKIKRLEQKEEFTKENLQTAGMTIGICTIVGAFLGMIFGFCAGIPKKGILYVHWDYFFPGILWGAVIGLIIGFLIIIVYVPYTNSQISKKNELINKENAKLAKQNQMIRNINNIKINEFNKNLTQIRSNYQQTLRLKQDYYECNILHKKYRNMIAVFSLYEYFEIGKCSQLTGHEGAYNIYDNELYQRIIISKLDEIITKLDEIKNTQYELYHAINESNKILNEINAKTDKFIHDNNEKSDNIALIEYNTRRTALNTEIIKWIKVYEVMK